MTKKKDKKEMMEKNQSNGYATAMETAYDENVRPALDIIDQIRRVGVERDIQIPQIAGNGVISPIVRDLKKFEFCVKKHIAFAKS